MFPQKAMILAAGLGKRMHPYTLSMPKPLVEVGGKTLVDWSLDLYVESGIQEVVVNAFYMADMLEAHLAKRATPRVIISREETLLETGGGIFKALPMLGEAPFFVINSDIIALNGVIPLLKHLAQRWNDEEMDGLLLLARTANAYGYYGQGDFHLGQQGELRRRSGNETVPFVFAGVQLLHPRLFKDAPQGAFSMNLLYDRGVSDDRVLPRVRGIAHDGLWLHVGDPRGKREAEAVLREYA